MTRNRILLGMIAFMVLLVILALGGYAIYRASWIQGYQFALQSGDVAITPAMSFSLAPFSTLLTIGMILVLLLVLGKFLGGLFWLSVNPGMIADWKQDPRRFHRMRHFHPGMNRCSYWAEYTNDKPDTNEAPGEASKA